jgi:hypothetical protein
MTRKNVSLEPIPPLTESSVGLYVSAVEAHMRAGKLEPVIGRECIKAATAMNAHISAQHSRRELAEMRELVARAERAQESLRGFAVAARYGQSGPGDAGLYGEWTRGEDGKLLPQ